MQDALIMDMKDVILATIECEAAVDPSTVFQQRFSADATEFVTKSFSLCLQPNCQFVDSSLHRKRTRMLTLRRHGPTRQMCTHLPDDQIRDNSASLELSPVPFWTTLVHIRVHEMQSQDLPRVSGQNLTMTPFRNYQNVTNDPCLRHCLQW